MKKLILILFISILCFSCDETLEKTDETYKISQELYQQISSDTIPTHTVILSHDKEHLYIIKDKKIEYDHYTPITTLLILFIFGFIIGFLIGFVIFSDN
jgi:hypothetical protein